LKLCEHGKQPLGTVRSYEKWMLSATAAWNVNRSDRRYAQTCGAERAVSCGTASEPLMNSRKRTRAGVHEQTKKGRRWRPYS
jgi:hypothetical protein